MADERGKEMFDSQLEVKRNIAVARKEVQNLRTEVKTMKNMFLAKFEEIENFLQQRQACSGQHTIEAVETSVKSPPECRHFKSVQSPYSPIGHLESCFKEKNGIPRQPSVCPTAKAKLRVTVSNFTNPQHALEGLVNFSHIWVLFIFHQNTNKAVRAKVKPPRLNGGKVGVFASRSPHRPNPIGLTLAKLDAIHGNTLLLSGIDIVDGTPVVDIKPYIPTYDKPVAMDTQNPVDEHVTMATDSSKVEGGDSTGDHGDLEEVQHVKDVESVSIAEWVSKPPVQELTVRFSDNAERQLSMFHEKRDVLHVRPFEKSHSSLSQCDSVDDEKVVTACGENCSPSGGDYRLLSVQQNRSKMQPSTAFLPGHDSDEDARCSCRGQCNTRGACIYELEMFSSVDEIRQSIMDILKADPRSVYRRNQCLGELYHFSIDKVNVTCSFDLQRVDVVSIEPIAFRADKAKAQSHTS